MLTCNNANQLIANKEMERHENKVFSEQWTKEGASLKNNNDVAIVSKEGKTKWDGENFEK